MARKGRMRAELPELPGNGLPRESPPSSVTCGDSFPRGGEVFWLSKKRTRGKFPRVRFLYFYTSLTGQPSRSAAVRSWVTRIVGRSPASRFVANFIGKANFIDGIFKGRDGEAALVEIGGKTFSIPAPGKMEGVEVGGACCLTVRPESFLLTKDAGALPGTVSRATYYGAKIEYEVMLNEQPIIVEVYNPQLTERFSVGDTVSLSLIEGCVRVLK